jgi:hypothetical protein
MDAGVGLQPEQMAKQLSLFTSTRIRQRGPILPDSIDGIPVNVILTDQFVAF